jgi:hypothetical protein
LVAVVGAITERDCWFIEEAHLGDCFIVYADKEGVVETKSGDFGGPTPILTRAYNETLSAFGITDARSSNV